MNLEMMGNLRNQDVKVNHQNRQMMEIQEHHMVSMVVEDMGMD